MTVTIEGMTTLARARGVAVTASTLAMGAGFLAGFYFAKRRLEKQIISAAEDHIAEQVEIARKHFTVINERDEKPASPEAAIEQLIPDAAAALAAYQGVDEEGVLTVQRARLVRLGEQGGAEIPAERRNNVWDDNATPHIETDFDYEDEIAARTPDAPYVISYDEFEDNERGHMQQKLTLFAGDGILIDETDEIVAEPEKWIGPLGGLRFGHRSGNNRIVYMRNENLDYDFAVALHDGKYAAVVAGLVTE